MITNSTLTESKNQSKSRGKNKREKKEIKAAKKNGKSNNAQQADGCCAGGKGCQIFWVDCIYANIKTISI